MLDFLPSCTRPGWRRHESNLSCTRKALTARKEVKEGRKGRREDRKEREAKKEKHERERKDREKENSNRLLWQRLWDLEQGFLGSESWQNH